MERKTTFAETEVVDSIPPGQPTRLPNSQMASVINIPPQIAVTVCWVALGFGICWWLMDRQNTKRNIR